MLTYLKLGLGALVIATITILWLDAKHLRTELATSRAELAAVGALGRQQAAKAAEVARQQAEKDDALQRQLESTLKAHGLVSIALADSVRRYASRGPCTVPGNSYPAGEPPSDPGDSSDSARIAETLAQLTAAAQRDADRFAALQHWAETLAR